MVDAFDDDDFFRDHLDLFLVQSFGFDHLDSVTLDLAIFTALINFTGCPRSYFSHELVVIDFFQNLGHEN